MPTNSPFGVLKGIAVRVIGTESCRKVKHLQRLPLLLRVWFVTGQHPFCVCELRWIAKYRLVLLSYSRS